MCTRVTAENTVDTTLEQLLDDLQVDVDIIEQQCSESNLLDFGTKFCDDWKMIGRYLKLEQNEITTIDSDCKTTVEKRVQTLLKWKEKFGHQATYRVLIEAFISYKLVDKATNMIQALKDQKIWNDKLGVEVKKDIEDLEKELSAIQRKFILEPMTGDLHMHELKAQCSALNPQVLNDQIFHGKSENEEIKQMMSSYMNELQSFRSKTKLSSFAGRGDTLGPSPASFSRLDIEFHDNWKDKTLEDLENFRKELACKPCFLTKVVISESLMVVFSILQTKSSSLECVEKYCNRSREILRIALDTECIFPKVNKEKSTAERLLQACKHEDASLAKEVLNSETFSEMDLRCQDESGNSPLMLASLFGNEKTVHLLLSHKVHVDSRNYKGQTALMLASEKGYDSIAEILLDHGAAIDLEDDNKHTALTYAILGRHRKVVTILLSHDAQIDSRSQEIGKNSQDENIRHAIVSRSAQSAMSSIIEGVLTGMLVAAASIANNPHARDILKSNEPILQNKTIKHFSSETKQSPLQPEPIQVNRNSHIMFRMPSIIVLLLAFLLYIFFWYPMLFVSILSLLLMFACMLYFW